MARTEAAGPQQPADTTAISLNRLLNRLEHVVLSGEGDSSLRSSTFERNKVRANLEHARSLLLRLEHDASIVKPNARRSTPQPNLQGQRELVGRLNKRLEELDQLDAGDESSDFTDEEEGADERPASYGPARQASDTIDKQYRNEGSQQLQDATEALTSSLRARKPAQSSAPDTATATGSTSHPANVMADPSVAQNETLQSYNRAEQENLTASLLNMAQALKNQSVQFGTSLESDKGLLDRAAEGLDKNQSGMEAAEKRMGTLRRMTEGRGWWGRILLYAWIAGLWAAAFLIVFVMPKIRF